MDFNQARYNMVEQQIRPWDVLDFDLLDVLGDVPREAFVLPEQQNVAYTDQALKLANGGMMLEPKIVARLIQALALNKGDKVLEVGTGSGYATAILAKLAGQVLSVDVDAEQQQRAQAALAGLDLGNIQFQVADGLAGVDSGAPYSAIYVGGSVPVLPAALQQQLADGGSMVVIVGADPVMRACLIRRQGNEFITRVLFDTVVPALHSPATPAPSAFSF